MLVPSRVSKLTYLAREDTPGTRVPPNKYLQGLNLLIVPNSTRGEVRPSGSTMRTGRPLVQNWSTFTIAEGSYLDFNSALYLLSSLLGMPTTTTPDGGTNAREHAFTFSADGSNVRPTYTFATGYRDGLAEESVRNVFQSVNFSFSRTAAPTLGGSGYGRNLDLTATLGVDEVQIITINGSPSGGTFTLTYDNETTDPLAYNASSSDVQVALRTLSTIGGTGVTVTGDAGGPYTVTFAGPLANTNAALIVGDASELTQDGDAGVVIETTVPGVGSTTNEEQTVTINPAADGGTFTLTFDGQTTEPIAYNAENTEVEAALEALSNIGESNVSVTGNAGGPWTVEFVGSLAETDVAEMTADASGLTQADDPSIVVTEDQAGGITTIPVRAIQAPEWDVYADDVVGEIGTTKIRPYMCEFTFNGLVNPDWVIDSTLPSYDDDVLQVPELALNLVLRNDATARAIYADLLDGATYYFRYQAIGPIIEGDLRYELRMDFAAQASENLGQFGDEGGAETMPFPLTIVSDNDFAGGGFSALLRNTLVGL